jgi:hypothetical protein
VNLGPGANAARNTDASIEIDNLPPVDLVLLSDVTEHHYSMRAQGSFFTLKICFQKAADLNRILKSPSYYATYVHL